MAFYPFIFYDAICVESRVYIETMCSIWIYYLSLSLLVTRVKISHSLNARTALQRTISSRILWKQQYHWEANLDAATGLASSKEISHCSCSRPISSFPHDCWNVDSVTGILYSCIKSCFESYPSWGILRLFTTTSSSSSKCWYPLLNFGSPETTLHPSKGNIQVKIPILGGRMVDPLAVNYGGYLSFTCTFHPNLLAQDCPTGTQQRLLVQYTPAWTIETQLVQYPPSIYSFLKKKFTWKSIHFIHTRLTTFVYLYTQSRIHAWVLWRFHLFCNKCLIRILDDENEATSTNKQTNKHILWTKMNENKNLH